jgi:hypothetical protein
MNRYGAPVLVGGLATGPLLDRFGAVRVMRLDSLFRGAVMASIPALALIGEVPLWALYAVSTSYGLLKMVPLAGVPTVIPTLVPADRLDTANAMESLSYGLSGVVAPMLAGALIAAVGGIAVLVLDSATFFLFAACLQGVRGERPAGGRDRVTYGLREASPLTIWAQTLRMRLIPPELRGRVFSLLRTAMQAAEPLGGALGGAVIASGGLVLALAGIATAIGAPGLLGLAHPALAPAHDPEPAVASA